MVHPRITGNERDNPGESEDGLGVKNEAVGYASSRSLEVNLAGDRGFEPRLSDSESDVLPLDESPLGGDHSSIEVCHGQTCTGIPVEEWLNHLFLVIGIICIHANQGGEALFLCASRFTWTPGATFQIVGE